MVTITTGVILLRWQLLNAVLMFSASTLSIRFRKSGYVDLVVISGGLGLAFAYWFATGLLDITLVDVSAIWKSIETVMVDVMSHTPSNWPMVLN